MQGFLKGWSQKAHVQTGLAYYYWPQVIGESLKDKIEVSHVRNGVLWVKTPDPALAHNLTFFKKEIITKYRRFLGENTIRSVRITIGALNAVDGHKTTGETKKKPVRSHALPLPEAIEGIKDPDLKQAFSRFYYAHQAQK
ncbi:MAG TPA: DUF721 domain-containing protein [Hydrogenispora sp.]|nr:DUF721 domain-containing protein [Hydrogenispora sp.]